MAGGTLELGFLFNKVKENYVDDIIKNIKIEIEHSFSKITFIDKDCKDINHIMVRFYMEYDALINNEKIRTEKEYIDELYRIENDLILFAKKNINEYSLDYIYIDANCPYNENYLLEDVINEDIYTVICYYTDRFNIKYSSWLLDGLRKR